MRSSAAFAESDLDGLLCHILQASRHGIALRHVERIEAFCRRLSDFPQRGHRRDDLVKGLRNVGFEQRLTMAFHAEADRVVIDRVLYAGAAFEASLADG